MYFLRRRLICLPVCSSSLGLVPLVAAAFLSRDNKGRQPGTCASSGWLPPEFFSLTMSDDRIDDDLMNIQHGQQQQEKGAWNISENKKFLGSDAVVSCYLNQPPFERLLTTTTTTTTYFTYHSARATDNILDGRNRSVCQGPPVCVRNSG